jgi:hypothetical protein
MQDLLQNIAGVLDQLNPFSLGNRIIYFTWLALYSFTLVAVWRSRHGWVRLVCLLANQLFSVGVLISWSLAILLAYTYWLASALLFLAVAGSTFYFFRGK